VCDGTNLIINVALYLVSYCSIFSAFMLMRPSQKALDPCGSN